MHIHWTPRDLTVFETLADTGSFRRTAAQVCLSQSAVSGVIARLEETLATRLFDRTTRSVHLTQAGKVFLDQVRLLQAQTEEAVRQVRSISELAVGKVRVAALPSLAATVVPRVMARFAKLYPGVALDLHDTLSGPAFDLVRSGQVDFALTAANPAYADLDHTPLTADGFVLLMPRDHPLARSAQPLGWLATAGLTHISMPLPASVRQYANQAFMHHRQAFEPRYAVEHIDHPRHGARGPGRGRAARAGRRVCAARRCGHPPPDRPRHPAPHWAGDAPGAFAVARVRSTHPAFAARNELPSALTRFTPHPHPP